MSASISLSLDECNCGLCDFYTHVARKMVVKDCDNVQFDCRRICVTKSVQDAIWNYYRSEDLSDTEISILLLMSGPKANLSGLEYRAEVEDGFIIGG